MANFNSWDGFYKIEAWLRVVIPVNRFTWLHNQTTLDGTLQVDGRTSVGG